MQLFELRKFSVIYFETFGQNSSEGASKKDGLASVAQIRNAILSSAVPTTPLAGKTVTGGRLDVNGVLSK